MLCTAKPPLLFALHFYLFSCVHSLSHSVTAPPEEEPTLTANFIRLSTNPSVSFADSSPKREPR